MEISNISTNISTYNTTEPAAVTSASDITVKAGMVNSRQDTVELSQNAQVKSLKQSGQTVAQIAQAMGLDENTVNEYLGLETSTSTATVKTATAAAVTAPAEPPAPAGGSAPSKSEPAPPASAVPAAL